MNGIKTVALDYANTISGEPYDRVIGQKPVDPEAAQAIRDLHALGVRLVLASNTMPNETRWPALQLAGIDHLFSAALLSDPLGVRKPEPLFYKLVITAAECAPGELLFVGDGLDTDVAAPMRHGMRAVLVRPHGLTGTERLPVGARLIRHVAELPGIVR